MITDADEVALRQEVGVVADGGGHVPTDGRVDRLELVPVVVVVAKCIGAARQHALLRADNVHHGGIAVQVDVDGESRRAKRQFFDAVCAVADGATNDGRDADDGRREGSGVRRKDETDNGDDDRDERIVLWVAQVFRGEGGKSAARGMAEHRS